MRFDDMNRPDASIGSSPVSTRRPMTIEDLFALKRLADPAISPDGTLIAYTVATVVDPAANKTSTSIWLVPSAGGACRQLTSTDKHDRHPRWSPDGKRILFESSRSGQNQLWVIAVDGGEAQQVTTIASEAGTGIWSPDGGSIAFVSAVFPEYSTLPYAESNRMTQERLDAQEKSPVKARVFTRMFYRHWDSWTQGKRLHIFVMPAPGQPVSDPMDITPGDSDAYPTSQTFEMGDDYTFSPDGKYIVFTAPPIANEAWNTNYALYRVPVAGGEAQCLTSDNKAASGGPRFSPDGSMLAYRAQRRPGYESDRWEIMVVATDSGSAIQGEPRSITADLDLSVHEFAWLDNGTILFTADDRGETPIFEVKLEPRAGTAPVHKRMYGYRMYDYSYGNITVSADGRTLSFQRSGFYNPPAIFAGQCRYFEPLLDTPVPCCNQVSTQNTELLAELDFGASVDSIYIEGAAGTQMQMWMIKPPGFRFDQKWPVVLVAHGGPQMAWENAWSWRWNMALWAAQSYVVAIPNFHGSSGFGQKYMDAVSQDWGGKAFVDCMAAVDYLKQLPYVDADRMGAAGASFGGYMMNWFQGHTDQFKCLITHCGVFNFESMIATEELWFDAREFGGRPWQVPDYAKFSPHRYAASFKTPNLIIHNDNDFRVPVGQGFELFNTLALLGVPSRMINFPDEGHWVLKPANSMLWHEEVFAWLRQYAPPGAK